MLKVIFRSLRELKSFLNRVYSFERLKSENLHCDFSVRCNDFTRLKKINDELVDIGPNVEIFVNTGKNLINAKPTEVVFQGRAVIGTGSNLRAGGADIIIGKHVMIAQMVSLLTSNHNSGREKPMMDQEEIDCDQPIVIGDDVWLGAGVFILGGVTVGEGAIVGANSLVNKDVPPYEIWAGSPARKIGER